MVMVTGTDIYKHYHKLSVIVHITSAIHSGTKEAEVKTNKLLSPALLILNIFFNLFLDLEFSNNKIYQNSIFTLNEKHSLQGAILG